MLKNYNLKKLLFLISLLVRMVDHLLYQLGEQGKVFLSVRVGIGLEGRI